MMKTSHFKPQVSVSEINAFIECPSAWALRYHYGYKQDFSAKMKRGVDFEGEVNLRLTNKDFSDIEYDITPLEREAVGPIVDIIENIAGGIPIELQYHLHRGNMLGYADYLVPGHIIDLKTTAQTPSKLSSSNMRQMAFYQFLSRYPEDCELTVIYAVFLKRSSDIVMFTTNADLHLHYTDHPFVKKSTMITDAEICKAQAENNLAMLQIASIKENPQLLKILPVDTNHFRMKDYDEYIVKKLMDGSLVPKE